MFTAGYIACMNIQTKDQYASNRPFSYSTKEPGSSVIFIHFYARASIE